EAATPAPAAAPEKPAPAPAPAAAAQPAVAKADTGDRVIASPLAKRIAAEKGIDLASVQGSGPKGRIVKGDVEGAPAQAAAAGKAATPPAAQAPAVAQPAQDFGIPHEEEKLSGMQKTIARRLTESKQTIPHFYVTVDVRLDALLKLRGELNAALESRGVRLRSEERRVG